MPKGKDGLYRRGGIFAFRFKACGTRDRQAARRFRQQFLDDLANDRLPTNMSDWRLDQAEEWWNTYRRPRIAEGTNRSEPYIIKHFKRILGNKRLREITNGDLDQYVTIRLAGYKYQHSDGKTVKLGPVGAWSINKEVRLWSLILKKAKSWHRLAEDYQPLKTKASDIGQALTREELQHLAKVAERNRDWEASFYGSVLAVNTGLRGGEIKKLRLGALDVRDRRCIRIVRGTTKTDASARLIELNSDACEAAARLILRANLLGSNKPEHFLMPKNLSRIAHGPHKRERRGYDPLQHQESWDTAWARLTEAAGFPNFRFHDLRHTFISHMVEMGVPLGVIQTFVGHMSGRMIRHYTHITSGAARKAVEMLDARPILVPELTASREMVQ